MLFLNQVPKLGDIDYEIYQYITENITKVPYMRIRELASETHTSIASVQRFCKKFQCDGFTEFKIKLKIYLEQQDNRTNSLNLDTFIYYNFLNRTKENEFQKTLAQAVKLLKQSEVVLFIGAGTSDLLSSYGATYFSALSKMAFRIENPITNPKNYLSEELLSKSCIVAISASGETIEIINCLTGLSFQQSKVIAITNHPDSTIAKLSEVAISYLIPKEQFKGQDVTSKIPVIFIIEYLAKLLQKN